MAAICEWRGSSQVEGLQLAKGLGIHKLQNANSQTDRICASCRTPTRKESLHSQAKPKLLAIEGFLCKFASLRFKFQSGTPAHQHPSQEKSLGQKFQPLLKFFSKPAPKVSSDSTSQRMGEPLQGSPILCSSGSELDDFCRTLFLKFKPFRPYLSL